MRLHTNREVIFPETFSLLKQLQSDPQLSKFFLVDGTALALQIGHRLSIDLDLFSKESFETPPLIEHLVQIHGMNLSAQSKNTILGFIDLVKVDFITHAYPLINPLLELDSLRLASTLDIGAMKLNAIANSGERIKDFIDIYFLLELHSLEELLDAYNLKYIHSNPIIALKAVSYFEDIDLAIDTPVMIHPLPFEKVKNRILKAVKSPALVFGQ